jgi:hypothetical protein
VGEVVENEPVPGFRLPVPAAKGHSWTRGGARNEQFQALSRNPQTEVVLIYTGLNGEGKTEIPVFDRSNPRS